ncbi:MAG TPA: SRPBCC family protein [Candidatus Thermoplasmatota archaeon]
MTFDSHHLSLTIAAPADAVYKFASDPRNLPFWAAGLAGSISENGDDWVADSPMGKIRIEFAAPNPYHVLDHVVILPSGERSLNPMRVVPNGNGCEVIFSLFKRRGITDEDFKKDARAVLSDLRALKQLMEKRR